MQAGGWELVCQRCGSRIAFGLIEMDRMLRGLKLLRPESKPDPDIVVELVRGAQPKLTCQQCGGQGLLLETAIEEANEDWGMARPCESCGKPIPAERLEIFPNTRLCTACQLGEERGQGRDELEYCPKCGTPMQVRQSGRTGITRYELSCPSCRR